MNKDLNYESNRKEKREMNEDFKRRKNTNIKYYTMPKKGITVKYYQENKSNIKDSTNKQSKLKDFANKKSKSKNSTEQKEKYLQELSQLTEDELELYNGLKELRRQLAMKESVPLYLILNNRSLLEMVKKQPSDFEELLDIYGIGEIKIKRYGEDILQTILQYS